jgi:hypothetical protein
MSDISKNFIDSINQKTNYENFSEEVAIIRETSAGTMTLYTVTNKNGVTFQKVPGQPNLKNRGFMGFVQGDRARPIMLSGSVEVSETESTDNTGTNQINQGGSGDGTDGQVDMSPSVGWDIKLIASAGGLGDDEKIEEYFIIVG